MAPAACDNASVLAALSVSQLARRIDGALRDLGDGWIEGEVRSITQHRSGHVYLTLADEDSNLDACIWKGRVKRCLPLPKQGDLVQAHYERIDFYAPRGATKLVVDEIRPTGEGELLRRRAEILQRLRADGLCDEQRRKPLRAFPRRVGVIAAQSSDAKVDVIRHLRERMPCQDIVFAAASVQGVEAVGSVIDALGRLQAIDDVDVIILARGGGSVADLVAFDDERLCRAVFACAVPVVTSIGHTKDRPNCDHVAAAFAPVPARAAEYAIARSADTLLEDFDRYLTHLSVTATATRRRYEQIAECWRQIRPVQRMERLAQDLLGAGELLRSRSRAACGEQKLMLSAAAGGLDRSATLLPRAAALNESREQMRRAATAFMNSQLQALDAHGRSLCDATHRTPRPAALDVCAVQLTNTAARLRERRRDYGRAFDRLCEDADRELRRRCAADSSTVSASAQLLRSAADRVLARAHERVTQLGALASAKDFRNRGWVLASDEQDQPVRSVGQLRRGSSLALMFIDGQAAVTVDKITSCQQGEGT
ncbi:MAG TPA: exodeoxyribonuclease VII large subunit [Solirubrobacteraceae bacterium]|jgi:exodeoxyribonuclease VII large subunit